MTDADADAVANLRNRAIPKNAACTSAAAVTLTAVGENDSTSESSTAPSTGVAIKGVDGKRGGGATAAAVATVEAAGAADEAAADAVTRVVTRAGMVHSGSAATGATAANGDNAPPEEEKEQDEDVVKALVLDWRALSPMGAGHDPSVVIDAPWIGRLPPPPRRRSHEGASGEGGAAEASAGVGAPRAEVTHDAVATEDSGLSREGVSEMNNAGCRFGAVLGSDVCFYYPLLHPLLDTAKESLDPDDGLLLVLGPAHREMHCEFFKALRSGAYNPRSDCRKGPWEGRTEMVLLDLDTFTRLAPEGGSAADREEGSGGQTKGGRGGRGGGAESKVYHKSSVTIGAVVHAQSGTPDDLLKGLLAGEYLATEADMEEQMYSF